MPKDIGTERNKQRDYFERSKIIGYSLILLGLFMAFAALMVLR